MCDIVDMPNEITGDGYNMLEGQKEIIIPFFFGDEVVFSDLFYEAGAKLYCEHPDTDWHLMEVPKGKALKCPAGTNLKIVLPEPFKL